MAHSYGFIYLAVYESISASHKTEILLYTFYRLQNNRARNVDVFLDPAVCCKFSGRKFMYGKSFKDVPLLKIQKMTLM